MKKNYGSCFQEFSREKGLHIAGTLFTRSDLFSWFGRHYPEMLDIENQLLKKTTNYRARGRWQLRPGADDMFFQLNDERFRLYNSSLDPAPYHDTAPPKTERTSVSRSQ